MELPIFIFPKEIQNKIIQNYKNLKHMDNETIIEQQITHLLKKT